MLCVAGQVGIPYDLVRAPTLLRVVRTQEVHSHPIRPGIRATTDPVRPETLTGGEEDVIRVINPSRPGIRGIGAVRPEAETAMDDVGEEIDPIRPATDDGDALTPKWTDTAQIDPFRLDPGQTGICELHQTARLLMCLDEYPLCSSIPKRVGSPPARTLSVDTAEEQQALSRPCNPGRILGLGRFVHHWVNSVLGPSSAPEEES